MKTETNRESATENENLLLFSEVEGVCPKCNMRLMYSSAKKKNKKYQIAHIYPLNPKPEEVELLKHETRLNSDVNHVDNLICLCPGCHTIFDKPRTLEGYREMYSIKKRIILKNIEKDNWSRHDLDGEIIYVIEELFKTQNDDDNSPELTYNPKTIDNKCNETLDRITKQRITNDVIEYFQLIKNKLKQLDALRPSTTERISGQIRLYFLLISSETDSQNEILEAMVEWIHRKTNLKSKRASEIIADFYIQNCEIFS